MDTEIMQASKNKMENVSSSSFFLKTFVKDWSFFFAWIFYRIHQEAQ